ncbi:hypothetical protein C8R43DRAFT_943110 [Mycena crocata]|nr:hypothetical protein C8R43DRAFT_943110 [Mycena crocata]
MSDRKTVSRLRPEHPPNPNIPLYLFKETFPSSLIFWILSAPVSIGLVNVNLPDFSQVQYGKLIEFSLLDSSISTSWRRNLQFAAIVDYNVNLDFWRYPISARTVRLLAITSSSLEFMCCDRRVSTVAEAHQQAIGGLN